jgi:hypothetical protein
VFDVELLAVQDCERRTIAFYSDVVCSWSSSAHRSPPGTTFARILLPVWVGVWLDCIANCCCCNSKGYFWLLRIDGGSIIRSSSVLSWIIKMMKHGRIWSFGVSFWKLACAPLMLKLLLPGCLVPHDLSSSFIGYTLVSLPSVFTKSSRSYCHLEINGNSLLDWIPCELPVCISESCFFSERSFQRSWAREVLQPAVHLHIAFGRCAPPQPSASSTQGQPVDQVRR